jgi:hypothetical protein
MFLSFSVFPFIYFYLSKLPSPTTSLFFLFVKLLGRDKLTNKPNIAKVLRMIGNGSLEGHEDSPGIQQALPFAP